MRLALLLLALALGSASVASAQTQALAVDPANPMNVLAGGNQGIYRSTDGGRSFAQVLQNAQGYGAAFGPPGSNRAHAAIAAPAAYFSTNGGASWTASAGVQNPQGRSIAAHPTDPTIVYLGTQADLYRSTDGGASYQVLSTTVRNTRALAISRQTPSRIFAGTEGNGLWRSLDAGASWTRLTASDLPTNATIRAIAIDPYDDDVVWVGREGTGVLRSTDGGATWALRSSGIDDRNILCLAIDPADTATIYAGTNSGLYVTKDAGLTWSRVSGLQPGQVYAVVVTPEGVVVGSNSAPSIPGALAGTTKRITSGSWSVGSNWQPPGVPTASDAVIVLGAVALDTSATVRSLRVSPQGALTWSGARTLTVTEDTQVLGALNVTSAGAVLVAQGTVTVLPTGLLHLASNAQVQLSTSARPSLRVAGTLRAASTAAQLRRAGGSGAVDVRVEPGAELDLDGLQVLHGDLEGLHVRAGATIKRLRRVHFDELAGGAGARHLTVEATSLQLSAPGCTFGALAGGQSNVLLVGVGAGPDEVTLTLEDRGPTISGPGAGEARDAEQGGATVNWVWACPDTTAGEAVGSPQVAWDLNTYDVYATYVAFRDVDGARTDRVYVLDADGEGVDRGYWFDVPQAQGDLVGGVWWDTAPTGQHVLWGTTTAGWIFLWVDPGAGAGPIAPAPGWPMKLVDAFTSPPVSDRTNVYAAGRQAQTPFFGAIDRQTQAVAWTTFLQHEVRTALATELAQGVNYVFAGTPRSGGRGRIFRVNTQTRNVDLTNADAEEAVTAYPFVIAGTGLFVGDLDGRLHGLDQLTFARKPGFPVQVSSAGIEAGVFVDFVGDERIYVADLAGRLWAVEPTGALVPGWGIAPMGNAPIRAAPLVDAGVLWAANAEGGVVAIDVATRATRAEWRFGAGARASDVAQEFTVGRTMISTSRGRLYVIASSAELAP